MAYRLVGKPLRTNFSEIFNEILNICIQENAFEYTVSNMTAILLGLSVNKASPSS